MSLVRTLEKKNNGILTSKTNNRGIHNLNKPRMTPSPTSEYFSND